MTEKTLLRVIQNNNNLQKFHSLLKLTLNNMMEFGFEIQSNFPKGRSTLNRKSEVGKS